MKTLINKIPELNRMLLILLFSLVKNTQKIILCFCFGAIMQIGTCQIIKPPIFLTYCKPDSVYGTSGSRYISGVELGLINNQNTGAYPGPHYRNYSSTHSTTLLKNSSYTLKVTNGTTFTSMRYAAWIDFNHDLDFNDAGEKLGEIAASSSSGTVSFSFNVPSTSYTGTTRMRIRYVYSTSVGVDPCAKYTYGETEDYGITIPDFVKVNTGQKGVYGPVTSLNIDSDNDLDIFNIHDGSAAVKVANTFRDDGATYNFYDYIPSDIPKMYSPEWSFCDLNNDNYLDAVFAGRNTSDESPYTLYYQRTGSNVLTNIATSIAPLQNGKIACADFNNDGRNDLIITGRDIGEEPHTFIYQNTASGFDMVNDKLVPLCSGGIECADYDNDKDVDIFLFGEDRYKNKHSIIYRNDGDWNFTEVDAGIYKTDEGFAAWADIDNNGTLDLVLTTQENIKIYSNKKYDEFLEITTNINEYSRGLLLGDCNNDGYLDLITQISDYIVIYLNSTYNSFDTNIPLYIKGYLVHDQKCFEIGDYNLDNKLDVLVREDSIYIMENTFTTANTLPFAPDTLEATTNSPDYGCVTLSWDKGYDNETSDSALTYNIRVSSVSYGNNIFPSMSNSRLFQTRMGNVYNNNSWVLKGLQPGTYYWSVQAIDNAYNSSPFSKQDTFVILPPLSLASYQFEGKVVDKYPGVDYDGDGDMDLLIENDSVRLYEQLSPGSYKTRALGQRISILNIADINNDNLPEIIYSNKDTLGCFIKQADKSLKKTIINTDSSYALNVADFDNDGYADLLTVQKDGIYIYKSKGNLTYTKYLIYSADTFGRYSDISSADIDSDGDIDFVVTGQTGPGLNSATIYKTLVFKNNSNFNFVVSQGLEPGIGGFYFLIPPRDNFYILPHIIFNSYNNDSYPDLLLTGKDRYGNSNTLVYINEGNGSFKTMETGLRPVNRNTTSWIDFNADGYIDALLPVLGTDDKIINLNYKNLYYYGLVSSIDTVLGGWFINHLDMDMDKVEDILVSKAVPKFPEGVKFRTNVFINNGGKPTTRPPQVKNLSHSVDSFNITLHWEQVSGRETIVRGLFLFPIDRFYDINFKKPFTDNYGNTYNIWLGKTKNTANIISPSANLSSGFNYIQKPGNVSGNTSWTIKNLPEGKYYWSVQVVDNSYTGGRWSAVDSFEVNLVVPEFSNTTVCLGNPTVFTDLSVATTSIKKWKWLFGDGTAISSEKSPQHTFKNPGTHYVTLWAFSSTGDSASITHAISVLPTPKVKFSVNPVCLGTVSEFINKSDTSLIDVQTWLWDFGDGITSSVQGDVTHTYVKTDTASLLIIATNGCSDADTQVVYIGKYPEFTLNKAQTDDFVLCSDDSSKIYVDPYVPEFIYTWKLDGNVALNKNDNKSYIYAKKEGEYSVTARDPFAGCLKNSNILIFTIPVMPEIYANKGPDIYYMTCSNTTADKYSWYHDSILIPSANKYYLLAGRKLGRYMVEIQEGGENCILRSEEITIPEENSASSQKAAEDPVSIFPNPNNGNFRIIFTQPDVYVRKIELIKLTGETLYAAELEKKTSEFTVQIAKPAPGVYMLKIGLEKEEISKMVVIQ